MCSCYLLCYLCSFFFFFSSRRRHTRSLCDWSSDVCSSDLGRNRNWMPALNGFSTKPFPKWSASSSEWLCVKPMASNRMQRSFRSEERRVGKECRYRWWPEHQRNKRKREDE